MAKTTPAVIALIVVNVLIFAATYLIAGQAERALGLLALHFPRQESFQPWQFFSYMFMHGSLGHLALNMFALFLFGSTLERLWGAKRFLTLYFLAGLGAGLISIGIDLYQFDAAFRDLVASGISESELQRFLDTGRIAATASAEGARQELIELSQAYHSRMVGASGAIYGVLVAFAILFPNAKLALIFLPVPIAAKYFVPALLLFDLFSGVTGISLFGGGIAHFAHVGGGLIGLALMLYWKTRKPERTREAEPELFR